MNLLTNRTSLISVKATLATRTSRMTLIKLRSQKAYVVMGADVGQCMFVGAHQRTLHLHMLGLSMLNIGAE